MCVLLIYGSVNETVHSSECIAVGVRVVTEQWKEEGLKEALVVIWGIFTRLLGRTERSNEKALRVTGLRMEIWILGLSKTFLDWTTNFDSAQLWIKEWVTSTLNAYPTWWSSNITQATVLGIFIFDIPWDGMADTRTSVYSLFSRQR